MSDPAYDFDAEPAEPTRWERLGHALQSRHLFWAWVAMVLVALVGGALLDGRSKDVDIYKVYDGDTLEWTPRDCLLSRIGLACVPQRLRLYGVDAFESAQTCRDADGKEWACGAVATQQHLQALTVRPNFSCNVDNEFVDRHAREFAVCTVDGKDVGAIMVDAGLAFLLWPGSAISAGRGRGEAAQDWRLVRKFRPPAILAPGRPQLGLAEFGPDTLAQRIDGSRPALFPVIPEGPAVAGRRPLHRGADLMDRAMRSVRNQRAVRAYLGPEALAGIGQRTSPGFNHPRSTIVPKGMRFSSRFCLMATVSSGAGTISAIRSRARAA